MSREIKTYILIVDSYRRPERQRNTQGRYRVGAKSKKEAVKLLRDKIKFGSIQVLCEWNPERDNENHTLQKLGYKEIVKEKFFPGTGIVQYPARCATDPISKNQRR